MKFQVSTLLLLLTTAMFAQQYSVKSPNQNLEIRVDNNNQLSYSVFFKENEIIKPSVISMHFSNGILLGKEAKVTASKTESVNQVLTPVLGKNKTIQDNYNVLKIDFDKGYSLILKAYNEGVAYRFVTRFNEKDVTVNNEIATFNFADNQEVIFPEGDKEMWSWERAYDTYSSLQSIDSTLFAITPTLFTNSHNRLRIAVAESDLWDYPGMYVYHTSGYKVKGKFAHYPKKVSDPDDVYKYHRVLEREDFLAKTSGKREYPWRVIIVTEKDTDLLNNELIYKLARPQEIKDVSYIKPGKNAWEWWHDAILETDKVKSGPENLSLELYKVYIDFASRNHLEYVTLDAGWKMDYLKELTDYAASKNVKVIVWTFINIPVEDPSVLDKYKQGGAVGVKVDLIERDDQIAMQWIEKFVKECAKRQLLVVLHGAPKPTGWQRTYPNIVNYEAVRGEECYKWDETPNPDYHVQFPFIRMLAGPLDFTPGSMRNVHRKDFKPIPHGVPNSMGTRVHEMAMYVVYDQYVCYLSDAPTEYDKYPDTMQFLSEVPTTWDKTLPLEAEVGQYIVTARQKGNTWYIGAMTNHEARELSIDFSFLPESAVYTVEVYRDNEKTDQDAKAYTHDRISVTRGTKLNFKLGAEGGLVLVLKNNSK